MAQATNVKKEQSREADIKTPEADVPEFDAKAVKKAKKEAKKAAKKAEKKGGLLVKLLAVLLVVLIFVAFWFNVFGIRSKYLMPFLQKIPVVNNLLPATDEVDPYADLTKEDVISQLNALQSELDDKDEQIKNLTDKNNLYAAQLVDLQQFRDQQTQFKADKEEFDRMIALNDPTAYSKFYEQVLPDNAEKLYSEAITQIQQSKELSEYISMYQNMDEAAAAKALSQLIRSDSDLVATIFKNLDPKKSGAILSEMSAQDAAQITKKMYPEQP